MEKRIYVKPEIQSELLMQIHHLLDAVSGGDQNPVTGVKSDDLIWNNDGFEDGEGDN